MTEKKDWSMLISEALEARRNAYVPYSHYTVGAALLCEDGEVIRGCNIENATYGATNCAERTAFFNAVSKGKRKFTALAITGGMEGAEPTDYAYPCGICRQVIKEFCADDFIIIVAKGRTEYEEYRLQGLLPHGFGGESIR